MEGVAMSLAGDFQGHVIFFSFPSLALEPKVVQCVWWGGELLKMREDQEEVERCKQEADGHIRINC